jgi:hypothetical protein
MHYTQGVPNLAQVDANIWRGGQISSQEGWDAIQHLAGNRHVHIIKLNFDTEGSDDLARKMGFDVLYVPVEPQGDQSLWDDLLSVWKGPDPEKIERAEELLALCKANPTTDFCYGHCTHGQDRTGFLFGKHRVLHDAWTKDAAYKEMLEHHFHPELHGVHEAWEDFKP